MKTQIKNITSTFYFILLLIAGCGIKKSDSPNLHKEAINESSIHPITPDTSKNIVLNDSELQGNDLIPVKTTFDNYNEAYRELEGMLRGYNNSSFKRAIFLVENAYFNQQLSYDGFKSCINEFTNICKLWMSSNKLTDYHDSDSLNVKKNLAIYMLLKDTINLTENIQVTLPMQYDFNDFFGQKDWINQFVTKLMVTKHGNCHSLPYLYKILTEEIGATAWLSIAPNHIYIKNRCKKTGWYNTELTSGEFPTDAWIKAFGYISIESIKNGIYMDTLGKKESIALCVYDLAKGYFIQTGNFSDGFVIKCCDLSLQYYPNNINAIILKAETLRKHYDIKMNKEEPELAQMYLNQMKDLYIKGLNLGYREMPRVMYMAWLNSINQQEGKFINSEIYRNFQTTIKP
jgi:hypothetical protein